MKPNFKELPKIYLHPGEVIYCKNPFVVTTILGSCIAITMYDKNSKFSAISHCQLPSGKGKDVNDARYKEAFKYVDHTIEKMIEKFEKHGIRRSDIEIKMFGGGDVIKNNGLEKKKDSVGKQNINSAFKVIEKMKLKFSTYDVGGTMGRKIFFVTNTGEIFLSRLKTYAED